MKCLTELQIPNLNSLYNLSDAHSRQSFKNGLTQIVEKLPDLFADSEASNYEKLLCTCLNTYMHCSGQYQFSSFEFLASCTASQSMEIVANYLRIKKINVHLVEPTFDNIPDILKRHGVELYPLEEKKFKNVDLLQNINIECIFLTLPNNPTGQILTKDEFDRLVAYCANNTITLIIDACFRLFDERAMFDWYEIIKKYTLKFIIIEDTGKIWPTQDLKVSFIISDNESIKLLSRISSDFLLNVSPFILRLVVEVAKNSTKNSFKDFRDLIKTNKDYLVTALSNNSCFTIENSDSKVSVVLLKKNFIAKSNELVDYLFDHGIGVLPGTPFYWHSPERGESYIRLALARDANYFRQGIDKLIISTNLFLDGVK